MQEKENGFEALINIENYDTFNFCFKNNFNIWDNNSGFNYIASIEVAEVQEPKQVEEIQAEPQTSNSEEIKSEQKKDKKFEETASTETSKLDEATKQLAIEEAFDNLLNSMMDFKEETVNQNVNLENGFGLQSVDEIKETDFTSCDEIFEDLYNELAQIEIPSSNNENIEKIQETEENNIQEIQEINEENSDSNENESNLENLLNDFSQKQEEKNKSINAEELDNLMDNILNSISYEENNKAQDTNEENTETSNSENANLLPTVKNQSSFENFIDKCIDGTYYLFKNIAKGCKKIGTLIKQKTQELLGEDDK